MACTQRIASARGTKQGGDHAPTTTRLSVGFSSFCLRSTSATISSTDSADVEGRGESTGSSLFSRVRCPTLDPASVGEDRPKASTSICSWERA
jgi:hypothetical protein